MTYDQSLRYAASVQLHDLDRLVTEFNKARVEAVSVLQRLVTVQTQFEHVARLREAASRRSSTISSGGDRALVHVQSRVDETRAMLEATLVEMTSISTQASALSKAIIQDVGQIHTNSRLTTYSLQVSQEQFNYEYGELQKAADIIRHQAHLLNSEIQVKAMQYQHCDSSQYKRLLTTWSAGLAAKDQDMDELADLMLT